MKSAPEVSREGPESDLLESACFVEVTLSIEFYVFLLFLLLPSTSQSGALQPNCCMEAEVCWLEE